MSCNRSLPAAEGVPSKLPCRLRRDSPTGLKGPGLPTFRIVGVYIYIHMYISLIYIYIYIYMCLFICLCICLFIYLFAYLGFQGLGVYIYMRDAIVIYHSLLSYVRVYSYIVGAELRTQP